MKAMSLAKIAAACGGQYIGDEKKATSEVSGVAIDSRLIEKDYLFIPLKGARVDGHTFIPSVMEKGALCTLSEHPISDPSHPYILVDSCEQALKDLAEHYRKALDITVIGVTGSVGKTSTKEMIASILSQKFRVLKTDGNYNNEIGLPLTIFRIREEHQIAVLEMGINHFEEMHRLSKMARPNICVITNIGICHLENLGDRDGVLKAKTEMFDNAMPNAICILNGDDDKLITLKSRNDISTRFFGLSDHFDAYADHIQSLSLKGSSCTLHIEEESIDVEIPIPGKHMVYNVLAGALIGKELGLSMEEVQAGVASCTPVSGRNNMILTDSLCIIDDCYNANPISTAASLDVLSTAETRKVAILGDMFELGEKEEELHFQIGEYAREKGIDVIICIGSLSKHTCEGAKGIHFPTKADFLSQAESLLKKGDTVLIKSSHGMHFSELVEKLQQMSFC